MAAKKSAAAHSRTTHRWQSSEGLDDLSPAERIAHDIVSGRRDLLPSVERIMTAGLSTDGTLRAIGLFRDAVGTPGDAHRDPRVAIAEGATALDRSRMTATEA